MKLSTAQNVHPGATDRNCQDGVALFGIEFDRSQNRRRLTLFAHLGHGATSRIDV
jgi:hypothetical protein